LGEENRLADFLSRWQTHKKYAVMFNQSIAKNIYEEIKVFVLSAKACCADFLH
jgi:hypothetical protein